MSSPRLASRVPSARFISSARLFGHKLIFHKKGKDGSAKCDAYSTNNSSDVIHGVLFEILLSEKPRLDRKEGLGNGYEEKSVILVSGGGDEYEAVTYYATHIDDSLRPYDWYKEHVLRGAREHGLPEDYIQAIDAHDSVPDPESYKKEMAIYC